MSIKKIIGKSYIHFIYIRKKKCYSNLIWLISVKIAYMALKSLNFSACKLIYKAKQDDLKSIDFYYQKFYLRKLHST